MHHYSEISSEILIELEKNSLNDFLNILKSELPHKIQQYNFILSYLYHYDTLNENRETIISDRWNVRFYGHRNGKTENCTIVTITKCKDYVITAFTLEKSRQELKECLQMTKLINWQNQTLDVMCDESIFKSVNDVLRRKYSYWTYLPLENVLHITTDTIIQLNTDEILPEGMYLAPLESLKHSKFIDDHWEHKDEQSLNFIRQSIEFNGGVGLFRRGYDQPICWISTNDFLTPGFLHTVTEERKKGYATLVLKTELKRILSIHNTDLCLFVLTNNLPSLSLHYKLGFKTVNRVIWILKTNCSA